MGTVHKLESRPRNTGQFRGWRPTPPPKKPKRWGPVQALLILLGVSLGALAGLAWMRSDPAAVDSATFTCWFPSVTDGDTFRCGGRRVRLQGIDAPEMPGHCRPGRDCTPGDPDASAANLRRMLQWKSVTCRQTDIDGYGRTVARCSAGEQDLSCGQLEGGFAVRRYGAISC